MGTHFFKCFCNRIRQDGTILPRNSKIETILLFLTIFGSVKYMILELPEALPAGPPPETCLGLAGAYSTPRPPARLWNDL